jgi:hypothetical protein
LLTLPRLRDGRYRADSKRISRYRYKRPFGGAKRLVLAESILMYSPIKKVTDVSTT